MQPPQKPSASSQQQLDALRQRGLAYPETHEDHPWGHSALKVKGKAFAFLYADAEGMSLSVKLPESNALALNLPFAQPTGYGLGKSGWVTARFGPKEKAPLEMLAAWLEESFRAVAPKRVAALLGSSGVTTVGSPARKQAPSKRAPSKKTPSKKAPSKKTPSKKAPSKKTPRKQAAAKKRA